MDDTSNEKAAFERLASATVPDDRILAALEAEFSGEPQAKRSVWSRLVTPDFRTRQARILASLGLAALALLVTSLGGLERHELPSVFTALVGGLGLCWLFLPSTVPGPTRATRSSRLVLMGLVLALTLAYLGLAIVTFEPLSIVLAQVPGARIVGCSLHVGLAGGLCLAALLWPWKRSDPFSPTLLGAGLGALAGYSSMLAVDAACASTEGFHVLFGHASAVAVFAALGALLGRRWLAP